MVRRLFEPVCDLGAILAELARDRAAGSTQSSRRPNNHRDSEFARDALSVSHRTRNRGTRHLEPDFQHRVLEQLAILGLLDRLELGADQFALESIEHARLGQFDGQVERGLPADRRQQRVRPLAFDDLREHRERHRLDVSAIRQFRIGHDRRGIRIDENQAQTFLAQRLDRLRARVVELAGLPDDDRPRANQQNRFQIFTKRQFENPDSLNLRLRRCLGGNDPLERFGAVTRETFQPVF